jgi:hypothetical protein
MYLLELLLFGDVALSLAFYASRDPAFSIRMAEVLRVRNKWVRIRQGKSSLEALCWDVPVREQMKGDFLVEFYGKTRILRGFTPR